MTRSDGLSDDFGNVGKLQSARGSALGWVGVPGVLWRRGGAREFVVEGEAGTWRASEADCLLPPKRVKILVPGLTP